MLLIPGPLWPCVVPWSRMNNAREEAKIADTQE